MLLHICRSIATARRRIDILCALIGAFGMYQEGLVLIRRAVSWVHAMVLRGMAGSTVPTLARGLQLRSQWDLCVESSICGFRETGLEWN